jgi:hypothetical protein
VSVWRIDRIFLEPGGEPLIVTQETWDTGAAGMYPGEDGSDTAVHHRSADPVALISLLTELGLLDPWDSGSPGAVVPAAAGDGAVEPAGAGAATGTLAGAVGSAGDPAAPGWWLLGGLFAGVAVTALTVRFLPAVRRRLLVPDPAPGDGDEPAPMITLPG